ncbi:MAG: hypothetical protein KGL39_25485 [Patescibacteria group bacterium]|nr:hypothetical protein [Patescibacteria group bacterium]
MFDRDQADKIRERGYSKAEMRRAQEEVNQRRRNWARRFQSFVETMLYHADEIGPEKIVTYARQLADAEEQVLDEKFPEGVVLEDDAE